MSVSVYLKAGSIVEVPTASNVISTQFTGTKSGPDDALKCVTDDNEEVAMFKLSDVSGYVLHPDQAYTAIHAAAVAHPRR